MKAALVISIVFLASSFLPGCDCSDEIAQTNNVQIPDAGTDTFEPTDVVDICSTCRDDQVCVDTQNGNACECPAGTVETDETCATETLCTPQTCNESGQCDDSGGTITCFCDVGWIGEFCDTCDAAGGWIPDGVGGCTDDPCSIIDCGQKRCDERNGGAVCVCPPGTTEDEMGTCIEDVVCTPSTCNMRGTCADTPDGPVCSCDEGWVAPSCATCDAAAGYHDDGQGNCTTDPCLPNPCQLPNQTSCVANGVDFACECDAGYHLENGSCVVDEVCTPDSCSTRGVCDDGSGIVQCTCEVGYAGDDCSTCDTGWHDDGTGTGTCTTSLCLPNPCTAIPNKTVCTEQNDAFICSCDAGFHDDGLGGCTTDPCLPNPCLANNQSCRVTNGLAECYTPQCDDGNVCTIGTVVDGVCRYTNVTDNTSCEIDLCTVGATCQSGQCDGGTPRLCDDGNACTDDTCDLQSGCVFTIDDTNTPDDGIACTDDICSNGFESHPPNHQSCDDGLFCSGVEQCVPNDPTSDAKGCLTSGIPQPPSNPGPCAMVGVCDEQTQSFPVTMLPNGASCNDGIACTQNDVCGNGGVCVGTPNSCSTAGACTSTTPMPTTTDIPIATLNTTVTFGGQTPDTFTTADSTYTSLYAVSRDTGTRHLIASYQWNTGGTVVEQKTSRIIAGVYDIMYRRDLTSSTELFARNTLDSDNVPNGMVILQKDVLIPAGPTVNLSFDVPIATLNTTVTFGGQAPDTFTTGDSTFTSLYAVSRYTGTRHLIASYQWNSGGAVVEQKTSRIIAGVYDIMYRRDLTSSTERFARNTLDSDNVPNGMVLLQKDVPIAAGPTVNLAIDVPIATLNTTVTFNGQNPDVFTTADSTFTSLYAVSRDTGTRHLIASYQWNTGGTVVEQKTSRIIAGVYDIMYRRDLTSSTERFARNTLDSDNVPNGMVLLQKDVAIAAGPTVNLAIDVPIATSNTTVTFGGQNPDVFTTADSTFTSLYAVSRDTGTRHLIASYQWNTGGTVVEQKTSRIIAGVYDIMYRRDLTSSTERFARNTLDSDNVPNGMVLLQKDVPIASGPTVNLSIDVPIATLNTTVTFGGQNPDVFTKADSTFTSLYAVSRDTGTRHLIASYQWNTGGTVVEQKTSRIIAGVYDIMYRRDLTSSTERFARNTLDSDNVPNGMVLLQEDVLIAAGPTVNLSVDVPIATLNNDVTFSGQNPDVFTKADSTFTSLYAVSRDTGTRHLLASYQWNTGGTVVEQETSRIVAGVYDIMYRRDLTSSTELFARNTLDSDNVPNGMVLIDQCISIP